MILARFERAAHGFCAFSVRGHAGYGVAGEDIVCASVSSAVMLTVNGITECAGIAAQVCVCEDEISCRLPKADDRGDLLINALHLHLTCLQEEYPENVQVSLCERQE